MHRIENPIENSGEPEVYTLVETLLARIQRALGVRLVGFYLYGSLVTGDFDPGVSDVDLLAVVESPLREAEFRTLEAMHLAVLAAYPAWRERIEIVYLPARALRAFRTESSPLAVISPGEPFNIKPAGIDWLMNWYLVRTMGQTLYGPPPATLIDPIAQAEFLQAVREHAYGWPAWIEAMRDDCKYQAYGVLTMCRTAYSIRHGVHVSKRKAATWAAAEWPSWSPVIRRALAWRVADRVDADPAVSFEETRRFVDFAVAQVKVMAHDSQA
ncbi:MAG: aminoglycoside adenylyltransferase domain-containing protein [Litorilinea sp.]